MEELQNIFFNFVKVAITNVMDNLTMETTHAHSKKETGDVQVHMHMHAHPNTQKLKNIHNFDSPCMQGQRKLTLQKKTGHSAKLVGQSYRPASSHISPQLIAELPAHLVALTVLLQLGTLMYTAEPAQHKWHESQILPFLCFQKLIMVCWGR